MNKNDLSILISSDTYDNICLDTKDTFKIIKMKQYTIDMEKVNVCGDVNAKLNAIFTILAGLNIVIQEYDMTEDLKKFVNEHFEPEN